MSLLCVNDNEIQLKRRNLKKKPAATTKVVRTQFLLEDKSPAAVAATVDVEKEEMKLAIERLIKDKTRLGLQLDQQTLKMRNIIESKQARMVHAESGRHLYSQKVDSAIYTLRKTITDLKMSERSVLYSEGAGAAGLSPVKTPTNFMLDGSILNSAKLGGAAGGGGGGGA